MSKSNQAPHVRNWLIRLQAARRLQIGLAVVILLIVLSA